MKKETNVDNAPTKEANHEAVPTPSISDEAGHWTQKPIGQPEDKNDDVIVSINDALFFLSEEDDHEDNDQCSRHLAAALFHRNRRLTSVTEATDEA